MNKNILLLAAAGVGLYFLMNKNNSSSVDITGYDPALIAAWIAKMKATPEWIAQQIDEAAKNGISIEDQLTNSAKWVISQGWSLT